VAAFRRISKGDFVVEYSGDLIDVKMAKERETKYAMDLSKGCYMYYFRANNRQYWWVFIFNGFMEDIGEFLFSYWI